MPIYTAKTTNDESTSFDEFAEVVISHLTADPTKFSVISYTDAKGAQHYPIVYNGKKFVLLVDEPEIDVGVAGYYLTYGFKKCEQWDDKTKQFVKGSWTGDYQFGVMLVGKEIPAGKTYLDVATDSEKKLFGVLDGILGAAKLALEKFRLCKKTLIGDLLKPLYTFPNKKGADLKPLRDDDGGFVSDLGKSPTLNVNCVSYLTPEFKLTHVQGQPIPAEAKYLATELNKVPQIGVAVGEKWDIKDISGPCRGMYYLRFGELKYGKKWSSKVSCKKAIIVPSSNKSDTQIGDDKLASLAKRNATKVVESHEEQDMSGDN